MSIEGLAAARLRREADAKALEERKARLARRMAWVRRAILVPLVLIVILFFWYAGYLYAQL